MGVQLRHYSLLALQSPVWSSVRGCSRVMQALYALACVFRTWVAMIQVVRISPKPASKGMQHASDFAFSLLALQSLVWSSARGCRRPMRAPHALAGVCRTWVAMIQIVRISPKPASKGMRDASYFAFCCVARQ